MLLKPHPIPLESARDVNRYLDEWAEDHLSSPRRWTDLLASTRDWADYSARNQLLLAAHGAIGPVAGIETWRLVPSTDGGTCAIRSGEHGLPVRVPVTAARVEPDPHLGRARPTRAAVAAWEWRHVFCLDQLARRPARGTIEPPHPPAALTGPGSDQAYLDVIRKAAKATVRGRVQLPEDPDEILALAAARLPRSSQRPPLDTALAQHAAALVAQRLGRFPTALPEFDPATQPPRERWELALDVLDPSRRLVAGVGKHLGEDLLASPLPRMVIDDDRVVPAERRHRLPRASLEQLPVGTWVEVGPYTADEWLARGEEAAGRGAYLRLNTSAYLVAIERGERAAWRLEDTRARTGAGILGTGESDSLDRAKADAVATLHDRYPQLAGVDTAHPGEISSAASETWVSLPDRPSDGSRKREFDHGIAAYVIPVASQWLPMLQTPHNAMLTPVADPVSTREEAMSTATLAGLRAVREATVESRVELDTAVAQLAASPAYSRKSLIERVSARLDGPERSAIASDPSPSELAELLGAAGLTSATTVAVLRAEGTDGAVVAPILPTLGIPTSKAIEILHARWELDRIAASELLGANATDMRAAGCTPAEILAARPTQVIANLPTDPHVWDLAGGTLAVAGHPPNEIGGLLASHAPTAECFAAGITAAVDDPALGIAIAVRKGMAPEAIAMTSERYGLSPAETAVALGDAGAAPAVSVPVLYQRCDADLTLTAQVARSTLQLRNDAVMAALGERELVDEDAIVDLRNARPLSRDRDALLAAHRPPVPARRTADLSAAEELLNNLPAPVGEPGTSASLLDSIPEPDTTSALGDDLLAAIPEPDLPDSTPDLEITR